MLFLLISSSSPNSLVAKAPSLFRTLSHFSKTKSTMSSINLKTHAFAGNPIRSKTPKSTDPFSPNSALQSLQTRLIDQQQQQSSSPQFKVLPFRKGRPLAGTVSGQSAPVWHLAWISLPDCHAIFANSGIQLTEETLVYLGSRSEEDVVYWAIDVSAEDKLVPELGSMQFCFVELRTLMVATDWSDDQAMGELAIAGHVSPLNQSHSVH